MTARLVLATDATAMVNALIFLFARVLERKLESMSCLIRRQFVRSIVFSLLFTLSFLSFNVSVRTEEPEPKRLRRSESFVGIHFDFHANEDCKGIGANTTPEMVQTILDMVKPDFIQVDSKGHPGWSSYPTKVGNPAPGVVTDSLKVWREVTARNGVALYTHYSGVWDNTAISRNPEWAVVDRSGNKSHEKASVFLEYKDKLLVPQLLEFALDYGLAGVWVDGECWATQIDYGTQAQEAFKKATNRIEIPTSPDQDGWLEWCNFHREAFREYLRSYVKAVKDRAPDYQIASNWAFTDHMADPVSADVDFISGDFSPTNSVNAARYSTRLMANQGKPWDLMAWSFASQNGWVPKTGIQLCREAACVLAQGGAFQAYYTQERDGSVRISKLESMAETAKFCRARQELCQYSTGVPQIALFCPTAKHYRDTSSQGEALFPMITWQRPILYRVLELNYAVDVLIDSALTQRIDEFPVVVFFRGDCWSETLKSKVKDYLDNGGSVVAIGNESIEELRAAIGAVEQTSSLLANEGWRLDVGRFGKGTIVMFPNPDNSSSDFVSADGSTFAKYLETGMKEAFPTPLIQLAERQPLDVSIRRTQSGRLAVHLVNVSGPHETEPVVDAIDPVLNVKAALNLSKRPSSIRLEPSGSSLDFDWQDGVATFTIPSIPIYEILVVD